MYSLSIFSARGKFLLSSIFLFICAFSSHAQDYKNCNEDQVAFKKISDTLTATRKNIKTNEDNLFYVQKVINDGLKEKIRQETAMEFYRNDATRYKNLKLVNDELVKEIDKLKIRESTIKKELKFFKTEERVLLNSYHLVRDRLDKNCGGVKKDTPKNRIADVSGTYNSPYGKTILKMEQGQFNVKLSGVVYYDGGGTSTLIGKFDGVHWNFSWKNTANQFGTGEMIYMSDETFSGTWTDKSTDPSTKGSWWLRPK